MAQAMQFGDEKYEVCGRLKACKPWAMTFEDGTKGEGFSGAVEIIGKTVSFSCDNTAFGVLRQFLGKAVHIVGVPKIGGKDGERGNVKIGELLAAFVDGRQVYARDGQAEAAVQPARDAINASLDQAKPPAARAGMFGSKAA